MKYDVIIVGGGMSGLTAAAYLTLSGHSVLLCEKENHCGGLVNSFKRNGFVLDGGIRALENAGVLQPMLRQLGLELDLVKNHISVGIGDRVIHINSDNDLFTYAHLLEHFYRDSKDEIAAITADMRKIMHYMDIQYGIDNPLFLDLKNDRDYFIKRVFPWMFKYALTAPRIMAINQPVVEYLRKFTKNQALLDIITQHFFTDTPAFFALSYLKLYQDYYYPKGGTGILPMKLVDLISGHGGNILTNTEIKTIDPSKRLITDSNGQIYNYHHLIWAADQKTLYRNSYTDDPGLKMIIDEKREELQSKSGNDSIFTLYLTVDLKPDYFQNVASGHFFYTPNPIGQSKAGEIPNEPDWKDIRTWLDQFFALTTYEISIPVLRDKSLAPEGKTGLIISMLFDYKLIRYIDDQGWYGKFKAHAKQAIIKTLDQSIYPGIEKSVMELFSSSPLTIEKITGNADGAITGWSFTNNPLPAENRLIRIAKAVETRLPNISQAGQWTYSPSGFPIAIITGKLAADRAIKKL